jgi:CheY-like chemotaxis protein
MSVPLAKPDCGACPRQRTCLLPFCSMPSPPSAHSSGTRDLSQCRRVLVVDDDFDCAELLGMLLERAGHQVCMANGAIDALALAGGFRPEVAIIDIGLPHMDGYELVCALRGNPQLEGCRYVAVSGYSELALQTRSRNAGFDLYLVKPLDFEAVVRAVTDLVGASGERASG